MPIDMNGATYIGKQKFLQGKTAIIRLSEREGFVVAQFDDLTLPLHLTHNWTNHLTSDFAIPLDRYLVSENSTSATELSWEDDWQEYLNQYGPQFNV